MDKNKNPVKKSRQTLLQWFLLKEGINKNILHASMTSGPTTKNN